MSAFKLYTVDRLEQKKAVLIQEATGQEIVVYQAEIQTRKNLQEGQILALPTNPKGQIQPGEAWVLVGLTRQRRFYRQQHHTISQDGDPGGDLEL